MSQERSGPDLIRATSPFAVEDRATTWRLLITTMLVFAVLEAAIVLLPWMAAKLVASLIAGLVIVRLFIFFHD